VRQPRSKCYTVLLNGRTTAPTLRPRPSLGGVSPVLEDPMSDTPNPDTPDEDEPDEDEPQPEPEAAEPAS
jgi:hypothetical protein